jgi:Rrf2 family protein
MYAIRAVVLMATLHDHPGRWTLRAVVERTGAPEAFMAKILSKLAQAGIIDSVKGPGGGFMLTPERADKLRLEEVVRTIDGDALFSGCALGFPRCDARKPCPIHDQVVQVRDRLHQLLTDTRIADLGHELEEGHTFLRGKLR